MRKRWVWFGFIIFLLIFIGLGIWWQRGAEYRNLEELQIFGMVNNWDPEKGKLKMTSRDGAERMYIANWPETQIATFDVDANGELNQPLVVTNASADWNTAFCTGDRVMIELKRNTKREWVAYKLTDQGPRLCR